MRDGQENPSLLASRLIHLRQDVLVLSDVFQHVKSAEDIELFTKGNSPGVHLEQFHARQAPRGERQSGAEYFASVQSQCG